MIPYALARRFGVLVDAGEAGFAARLRADADRTVLPDLVRRFGPLTQVDELDAPAFEAALAESYAASGAAVALAADSLGEGSGLDLIARQIAESDDLLDDREDAPAIRLINGVIADAVRQGASDIHFEPYQSVMIVRQRVDGELREALRLPPRVAPVIASRLKVMARLDIAERRLPQDGRIGLMLGGRSVDVRVSTLPGRAGERVVLRLLDAAQAVAPLDALGLDAETLEGLRAALATPNGLILVTGPTGSGKTTTLYAALGLLNDGRRNILTVEDPVEYAVDGIGQTQVDAKVGLTFANGLRAILRQDPDVVLVGEIRDAETASIAVQAALTGHLVLATVHTNDAVGAITRLRDMGVEPFLLASTLRAVLAQRLVRRLCGACAGAGCPDCAQSGYKGRTGLFEFIAVDEKIRKRIAADAGEERIAERAFARRPRLADAAQALVAAGVTSAEEAVRVTRLDGAHG
jgi:general secretion pathway protein E